jgi:hypothetical protein
MSCWFRRDAHDVQSFLVGKSMSPKFAGLLSWHMTLKTSLTCERGLDPY